MAREIIDETESPDRRKFERRAFERPCKLLHGPTLRYMAAETRDLSSGGVLLEVSHHRTLHVGDRVDVMVDWSRQGLVGRSKMLPATVAWIAGPEGLRQQVGIRFAEELTVSQAA